MKLSDPLPSDLYLAAQVRELDRVTIEDHGIPGSQLMARAGKTALRILRHHWPEAQRYNIVCGVGNNAGDGYVLARLARAEGYKARVFQVGEVSRLRGDAKTAYEAFLSSGGTPLPFSEGCLAGADINVDALLGTGLTGEVRSPFREAIAAINLAKLPTLSIDIPSGLCADTGTPLGEAVRAEVTVTFIGLKLGLFTGEGPAYAGKVLFSDLKVPEEVYHSVRPCAQRLSLESLSKKWLSPRKRTAHKGNFGHVLVIGGAPGYAGAARLASEAAARVGAGLVSLATHPNHAAQITAFRPEIMAHAAADPKDLVDLLKRATVLVLGPGLSSSDWGVALWKVAMASNLPIVLDADALNLLAATQDQEFLPRSHWVFTPHPGEASRLLGKTAAQVQNNRTAALADLIQKYGGTWVLKGAGTLVSNDQNLIGVCSVSNPGMASGGMGDVLSGVIGGLLAQGIPAPEAAQLGVCLHAEAAVLASREGERGMLASDLMPYLRRLANP